MASNPYIYALIIVYGNCSLCFLCFLPESLDYSKKTKQDVCMSIGLQTLHVLPIKAPLDESSSTRRVLTDSVAQRSVHWLMDQLYQTP